MGRIRKRYDGTFKAKVALQAIRGERTTAEIASDFGIHPNLVTLWKKQALEALPAVFSERQKRREEDRDSMESELYRQIGQLKVELDWLKKKSEKLR